MAQKHHHASQAQMPVTPMSVLGEMTWLYAASSLHQNWSFNSIHQWLTPAIAANQYRLYRRKGKPVGLVTWAFLSPEIETAYVRNPRTLHPKDWQSGNRGWIIDFIAPYGDAKFIARDLKNNLFANDVGRMLRVKKGSDTMRIHYLHGAKALHKARDWENNPTVSLETKTRDDPK